LSFIEEILKPTLEKNFKSYFVHAIEHLVEEIQTESNILQVIVNIQASLEILSKLYVLNHFGWEKIIENKFHNKSEQELEELIYTGMLKTKNFSSIKNILIDNIQFDDTDNELLNNFQKYRNQVMHLGIKNLSEDILDEAVWFIVRIINVIGWQDILQIKNQYLDNSLASLLGGNLYHKLILKSGYIDEAVDNAEDKYDDVKYCFICGNNTLCANDWDDNYKCLVCGCQISNDDSVRYIDCPTCHKRGTVIYDALNISDNEYLKAVCCACKTYTNVSECNICKEVHIKTETCSFCND